MAAATTAAAVTVAQLNCSCVAKNVFERHQVHTEKDSHTWTSILAASDNTLTLLSEVFSLDTFKMLISKCADRGIAMDTAAGEIVRGDYMISPDLLRNIDLGRKRLISLPARLTDEIQGDAGVVRRPAATNLSTGWESSDEEQYVHAWFKFMFDLTIEIGGRPYVPFQLLLTTVPYNALTPSERACTTWWQLFYLLGYDLATRHILTTVPNAFTLRSKLIPIAMSVEDQLFAVVSAMLATGVQVFCLNEASRAMYYRLLEVLGDTHHVVCATKSEMRAQHSIVVLDRNLGAPIHVEQGWGPEHLIVHVVKKEVSYLVSCYHGDSSGKETESAIRLVRGRAKERNIDRVVMGLDANCTMIVGNREKISTDVVVRACVEAEFVAVPKPGDSEYPTTWGARTTFQAQGHKGVCVSHIGAAKTADQRDYVVTNGDVEAVAVIASVKDVARRDGPAKGVVTLPSAVDSWVSDHGAVVATITWCGRS